jgi:hypothetical protein
VGSAFRLKGGGGVHISAKALLKLSHAVEVLRIRNPHNLDANPDSACHFDADPDADPDPACHFDADVLEPDPDPPFHFNVDQDQRA